MKIVLFRTPKYQPRARAVDFKRLLEGIVKKPVNRQPIAFKANVKGRSTSKPRRNSGHKIGPPVGELWIWLTREMLESPAFESLSHNAYRVLFRICIEHLSEGLQSNGQLIVTHEQFSASGANKNLVADAIDELEYKGLIDVERGRAGIGTPHPNRFTLTWYGTCDRSAATNRWKSLTANDVAHWKERARASAETRRRTTSRNRTSRKSTAP